MLTTYPELKAAVFALPDEEREELTGLLLETITEGDRSEIRREWLEVARERMADIKSGRVKGISEAEANRSLLEILL